MNIPCYVESLIYLSKSGIISKDNLISRIDSIILHCNDVPHEIIDASFASSKRLEDICMFLNDYTSKHEIDYVAVKRQVMNELFKSYKEEELSLGAATHCLYLLSMIFPFLDEHEQNEMIMLGDDYYLATEGIYGIIDDVKERLEKFMAAYITL